MAIFNQFLNLLRHCNLFLHLHSLVKIIMNKPNRIFSSCKTLKIQSTYASSCHDYNLISNLLGVNSTIFPESLQNEFVEL